ncbi:unnamed protein product [Diatraea saccharalis]|uniref:Uncharacterized protein n=1 Tax=Diatraea saccharalis TaxID=40085 RepID=A0A9N9R665_9NEOP|nr:unnamed protein product [Diatraea saccharalis]
MPVDRTPPNTDLTHYASDPNISERLDDESMFSQITSRIKRKREQSNEKSDFSDFQQRLFKLFQDLKEHQQENYANMQSTMEELKSQNLRLQESVKFVAAKYEEVMTKLKKIEDDRKEDSNYITTIRRKSRIFGATITIWQLRNLKYT